VFCAILFGDAERRSFRAAILFASDVVNLVSVRRKNVRDRCTVAHEGFSSMRVSCAGQRLPVLIQVQNRPPKGRRLSTSRVRNRSTSDIPWGKLKEKRMTIAAGFVYRNGALLCADTEVSGWSMTVYASKLMHFSCPGGKIGMAYAGNSGFAISTMQKCERRLQDVPAQDTLREIERIVDREYRKTVLSQTRHARIGNHRIFWVS
jgi:hypothetical protein